MSQDMPSEPCAAVPNNQMTATDQVEKAPNVGPEVLELRAEVERLGRLVYAPGLWRCAKCDFQLVQSNLNANTGTVTARDNPGDKCPNCDVPMWRVTWKDNALESQREAEAMFERFESVWKIIEAELPDFVGKRKGQERHLVAIEAIEQMSETAGRFNATLLWLLYNHQQPADPVGKAIRYTLQMGSFQPMSGTQKTEAQRFRDFWKEDVSGG